MNLTQQVGAETSVNFDLIDRALGVATQPIVHSGATYHPGAIRDALSQFVQPTLPLTIEDDEEGDWLDTWTAREEKGFQRVEDRDQLGRLLAHLNDRQRYAVIQRYAYGTEYEEIGEALGVTRQAATGLAERGLRKLQEIAG